MKKSQFIHQIILIILAISFTFCLFYLTLEIPTLLNILLIPLFPGVDFISPDWNDLYNVARIVGSLCFSGIIILIVLGFVLKKEKLSSLGNIILYFPIFGHFFMAMFVFLGIQWIQVILIPLGDIHDFFNLDNVSITSVFELPSILVNQFTSNWSEFNAVLSSISYIFMIIGLFLFSIGILNWLQGTIKKLDVFTFSLYKYSRHPQYLGYLFWSYGIYLNTLANNIIVRGAFYFDYSFLWFITLLITIGICLYEEVRLTEKYGDKYLQYRSRTSFLIPLPQILRKLFMKPLRFVFKKDYPEKKREILMIVAFYGIFIIIISLIINQFLIT